MNKLNLFIILILSIVFSLGFRVLEGACNYDIKSASKEQKKTLCAATNIHKNNLSMSDYKKIAHKLIQAEVHKKFAEHEQSGKVKRFLDSDSIAQVDRAVDAYQGGEDEIDLTPGGGIHRSMGTYGNPNPDNRDDAPWPGPGGETGGYPPGPPKVRRRSFSLNKTGSIEKHMYNARTTAKDGIPGNTGYLDVQPLGTFSNAGLGRATPLSVWAGGSDDSKSYAKKLVGFRNEGSNFEVNPLFNEIMNDTAFQNKFSTAFMKLLESFDPTPQKRYTLPLLKFFLKQEFNMKVGANKDPDIKQPRLVSRPGTFTTFPDIEDMRSTHFEDLAWFDQNNIDCRRTREISISMRVSTNSVIPSMVLGAK